MLVIIRVDASEKIGSGHVIRCLTLAESLRENDVTVLFFSRNHPGNLNHLIINKGFQVVELPEPDLPFNKINKEHLKVDKYQDWLGVSEKKDAEETIQYIEPDKPDWLIIDHYSLGKNWEKQMRPFVKNIMVIDDFTDRFHDCDLLLNQNYSKNNVEFYQDMVSKSTDIFFGPKYALLKQEYAEARKKLRKHNGTVERVLIFLGGSDPENLTSMAIEALSQPDLQSIHLDVVIGVNHPNVEKIQNQCSARGRAKCYTFLPHLANLMIKADMSIGAGGSTTWERLCLGLPSIVVSTATNQVPASLALGEDGIVEYLGKSSNISTEILSKKVYELVNSPQKLIQQSVSGQKLVDGMGVQRTMDKIL